jgi:branched-chain amino acid transport system ATP-binding protein
MAETVLELRGLGVQFGGLKAVNDVTLTVDKGDFLGLIGPNGAGKTTIFNLVTGAVKPTAGQIVFKGQSIVGLRPDLIHHRGISRTFQNIRLFTQMTALENVAIALHSRPRYTIWESFLRTRRVARSDAELRAQAQEYLDLVGLGHYARERAGNLPYGLQRKLEIARSLAARPDLLLLDEPAAGMNNEECTGLVAFLRRLHQDTGLTIVMIEHHMNVVMELCPRILVLNLGERLAEGTPKEIQSNPAVIKAYLGERRQAHA